VNAVRVRHIDTEKVADLVAPALAEKVEAGRWSEADALLLIVFSVLACRAEEHDGGA
jgi:hypothetical protein